MVSIDVSLLLPALCTVILLVITYSLLRVRCLIDHRTARSLVLVFGDLDRSPRMRNHAGSLCKQSKDVALCGYGKTISPERTLCAIMTIPHYQCPTWLPYPLQVPVKLGIFVLQSFSILLKVPPLDVIILQNPPTFPSIILGWILKWLNGNNNCRLVVDMHNTGYSIVAMKLKFLETPAMWFEKFCLRTLPDTVLVVSEAFQIFLLEWGVQSTVVYDRPSEAIRPANDEKKKELWEELREEFPVLKDIGDKPFVVVSSTSWTPDEDFTLVLRVLPEVDKDIAKAGRKMVLFITGKGAMKDAFMKSVNELELKNITVLSVWLAIEKYPVMLSLADFGLSMHQSSSGIDLPMKVIDMFGTGIPVIARSFAALSELVQDSVNGFVFSDAAELAELLVKVIALDAAAVTKLRKGVEAWRSKNGGWDEQWNQVVWPLVEPCFQPDESDD
eukprot:GEMP01021613.1.p1 GENE.GEMP01021613.1~~GEMP01021613.1.p1  ORF type:complete len:458 (+),score=78.21 GEMP01021613.1:45-1376(+)